MAERKGFEPLRALGALHDFQSCALDQLSHLSIYSAVSFHIQLRVSQECFNIISVQGINVKAFLQFFSKKYKFKKSQVLHLQNTFVRDKTY